MSGAELGCCVNTGADLCVKRAGEQAVSAMLQVVLGFGDICGGGKGGPGLCRRG